MTESFVALLRQKSGLSQSEFASKAGMNLDTLRDLEHGRSRPSLPSAEKIASTAGVGAVSVLVAAHVESAQKGEIHPEGLLRKAEKWATWADEAEDPKDRHALTEGASELLAVAQTAAKNADEDLDDVDGFGRKRTKLFSTDRTLAAGEQDSGRADNLDEDTDIHGRKGAKLFNTRPN